MAYIFWTETEVEFLKQNAGKMTYAKIGESFNPVKTESSVTKKAKKLGLSSDLRRREYFHNESYWKTPNYENSYYAGYLAADGCIQRGGKTLTIETVGDDEHLEEMGKRLGFTGELYKYHRVTTYTPNGIDVARLQINCTNEYSEDLNRNFKVCANKTKRVELPDLPLDLLLCFVKGYIDGDGDIGMQHNAVRVRIWSSAEDSILKMKNIINDNLLKNYRYKTEDNDFITSQRCKGIGFLGLRAAILFDYLSQLPTPSLSRKWRKPEVLAYVSSMKEQFPDKFITFVPNQLSLV